MYQILIVSKESILKDQLAESLHTHKIPASILEAQDTEQAKFLIQNTELSVDLFLIAIDLLDTSTLQFAIALRKDTRYAFTPIIVYSSDLDFLNAACRKIYCCGYLLKATLQEDLPRVIQFINYNIEHTAPAPLDKNYIDLDLPSVYRKIPVDEILFIESREKKCIIHTFQEEIPVSLPIKKLLDLTPHNSLVQSHRSFLINLANIRKIDKSQEPWVVSFICSNQQAYISRYYKKYVQQFLHPWE